jgi:hypothetical protein
MRAPSISFLFPNGPVNPTVPPAAFVIATEADDGITTESGDEITTE